MNYFQVFTKPITSQGIVSYNKDVRANNVIRLKKILLDAFGDLRHEKNAFYKIELYPNYQELLERIQQIKENKEAVPMLLFLFK